LTRVVDQISVYAHAACALLERSGTMAYRIGAAILPAFGDEDEFKGELGNTCNKPEDVVRARAELFAGIIDRISGASFRQTVADGHVWLVPVRARVPQDTRPTTPRPLKKRCSSPACLISSSSRAVAA
jgi:hypothetical protein